MELWPITDASLYLAHLVTQIFVLQRVALQPTLLQRLHSFTAQDRGLLGLVLHPHFPSAHLFSLPPSFAHQVEKKQACGICDGVKLVQQPLEGADWMCWQVVRGRVNQTSAHPSPSKEPVKVGGGWEADHRTRRGRKDPPALCSDLL